jgi:mannose-6-phosphate isomerase
MDKLRGVIQPYPWGSRSVIARLQGRPVPSPGPEAELWFGTHPAAPSTVECDGTWVPLTDLLGARLPYLVKVLAAEEPLSLQAHPDAEQARAGFAAGNPSYVDPYHKPELLVAVGAFDALCGFRDPAASADLLRRLAVPALDQVAGMLAGPGAAGDRLRRAVLALLSWPPEDRAATVSRVAALPVFGDLARRYPQDPGVLVALLLNHVRLAPGEAIWMPAGNLHSYLHGTGVEIMAASDNVLRGGLTGKRVDVEELLKVLRFEVLADPVLRPVRLAPAVLTWPVPVDDFALYRVSVQHSTVEVTAPVPRVVLCLSGRATVDDGTGPVGLGPGDGAFGQNGGHALTVAGEAEVYVATAGPPGR